MDNEKFWEEFIKEQEKLRKEEQIMRELEAD